MTSRGGTSEARLADIVVLSVVESEVMRKSTAVADSAISICVLNS